MQLFSVPAEKLAEPERKKSHLVNRHACDV